MKFFLDTTDRRLPYSKRKLKKLGYEVGDLDIFDMSKIKKDDYIILSPAHRWSCEIAKRIPTNAHVVCGKVDDEIARIFDDKQVDYLNLMQSEEFVLKNAILTAEGTLADMIFYTPKSIFENRILILGGGRVAKAVACLLCRIGIRFDISMRNPEKLLEAELVADNQVLWEEFKSKLKDYDIVINTIPQKLFDENDIEKFKENSCVFELASKQCLEDLKIKNFSYILCPALPSKYTPESAGELIVDEIMKKIKGE